MADIISPRERGRYMGLFGGVMALGDGRRPAPGRPHHRHDRMALELLRRAPLRRRGAHHPAAHAAPAQAPHAEGPDRLPRHRAAGGVRLAAAHLGQHRRRLVRLVEHRDGPHGRRRHPRRPPLRDRRAARAGPAGPDVAVPQPHLHALGDRVDRHRHRDVRSIRLPRSVHAARARRHAHRGRPHDDPDDRGSAAVVDRRGRAHHALRPLEALPHRRLGLPDRRLVPAVDDPLRHELRAGLGATCSCSARASA